MRILLTQTQGTQPDRLLMTVYDGMKCVALCAAAVRASITGAGEALLRASIEVRYGKSTGREGVLESR
jgi:hypothetical protein